MNGSRPELKVYEELEEAEEALPASEIAERTGMNYNTVKGVLTSLERMGNIETIDTSSAKYYRLQRGAVANA